jgi:hypothetical protein
MEPRVKRIALLLVLVTVFSSCKTVVVHDTTQTGGVNPRDAVDRFLAGARAQDLQAIGAVFGNEQGPMRDHSDRAIIERQLLIQLQCARHDKATVSEPVRGEGGRQVFVVEMKQGTNTATVHFTTIKGPSDRWYVLIFEIQALQNKGFCNKAGG